MVHLKRITGACLLTAVLLPTIATHAATYYVAVSGSNSNPGTETKPWRTVAYAVTSMIAGDTTYIRGGTYDEGLIRFKVSGTPSAPIQLLNYPGESPTIRCMSAAQFHRIILEHSSSRTPIGWITIEGLEIQNCSEAIKLNAAHDVMIRGNWIHDNGHGMHGNGTRILFDRNRVNHNGQFAKCAAEEANGDINSTCTKDHGIYVNGTAWTITNNLIYDNLAFGIQMNGVKMYDPSKHPGPEYILSHNWVVANNTFAYQRYAGGMVIWGASCHNARIENNIFFENAQTRPSRVAQGIHFTSMTCTEVSIRNNLAYASEPGGTVFLGSGANEWVHYTQSGNIVNTSPPEFSNAPATIPDSPNFSLTDRSPAIDAALTNTAVRIAFEGTPRPQGRALDIGAYEFRDNGQGPEAPKALQAR